MTWALVSTVDTFGPEFPSGVFVYADKDEAYMAAATMLVEQCDGYVVGGQHDDGTFWWEYDGQRFGDAELLLDAWQNQLSATEYFHVMPVKNVAEPSFDSYIHELGRVFKSELHIKPEDVEACVKELRDLPVIGSNARVMPGVTVLTPMFLDRDHESFVRSIERMNQMYRLQVSNVPTLMFVDNKSDGSQIKVTASDRLEMFNATLLDELREINAIIKLADQLAKSQADPIGSPIVLKEFNGATMIADNREVAITCLTSVADLLADIIVYCVSEMRKFGLPPAAILQIVMESNMSKLQPDGSAKYDNNGKFLKGPNYFPPEPKIKELITELLTGHDPLEAPQLS